MRRYYTRVAHQIVVDARSFGVLGLIVSAVIGVAAALVSREVGWIPRGGAGWTILVALSPYVVFIVLTLIFNALRAPFKLDNHRGIRIKMLRDSSRRRLRSSAELSEGLRGKIAESEAVNERLRKQIIEKQASPKRSPGEEQRYQAAKVAVEKLNPEEIAVLRHLRVHGEIIDNPITGLSTASPRVTSRANFTDFGYFADPTQSRDKIRDRTLRRAQQRTGDLENCAGYGSPSRRASLRLKVR